MKYRRICEQHNTLARAVPSRRVIFSAFLMLLSAGRNFVRVFR